MQIHSSFPLPIVDRDSVSKKPSDGAAHIDKPKHISLLPLSWSTLRFTLYRAVIGNGTFLVVVRIEAKARTTSTTSAALWIEERHRQHGGDGEVVVNGRVPNVDVARVTEGRFIA
jgi:hypothetical protein